MKYVPPVGGAPGDPYVDGDPGTGVDGSPVPAAAIEHPMREIEAVIVAAGLTPSASNLAQLLAALPGALAASSAMARSLADRGYQKLPGGLIIQWGYDAATTGGSSVSFPIAFPTACLQVVIGQTGSFGVTYNPGALNPNNFTLSNSSTSGSHRWLAVGH